ncbi:hypothetical protein T08_11051 [Trichinella sp. T8]|nr:hypothetical protein T08_11051 [Trichinella sp. T8]
MRLQSKLCLQTIPLTFNARHWFVIVGYFLNFAFSRLTCTWMKGTIFIQKQEQPVISILISLLREGIIEVLCKCCKGKIESTLGCYLDNRFERRN